MTARSAKISLMSLPSVGFTTLLVDEVIVSTKHILISGEGC